MQRSSGKVFPGIPDSAPSCTKFSLAAALEALGCSLGSSWELLGGLWELFFKFWGALWGALGWPWGPVLRFLFLIGKYCVVAENELLALRFK